MQVAQKLNKLHIIYLSPCHYNNIQGRIDVAIHTDNVAFHRSFPGSLSVGTAPRRTNFRCDITANSIDNAMNNPCKKQMILLSKIE